MTGASRVLVALRVPAGQQRAFDAFTGEIGTWWKPNALFRFRAGPSGTLAFEPGPAGRLVEHYPDGSTFTVGQVLTWDPPRGLSLTWRTASFAADQSTELRIRFEDHGAETRVVVEHLGWDAIPADHVARHGFPLPAFQQRWAEWWQDLLARLATVA